MSKKTLKDFKSKGKKVDLVHPEVGETGAWIEVRSVRCNEYLHKLAELDREEGEEKPTFEDNLEASAELTATLVTNWDEEFFEKPFSYDACVELFKDAENFWIRDAVNKTQEDQNNFFTKN